MSKYSKWWKEAVVILGGVGYFLTPSLQAWAQAHPGTKVSTLIGVILTAYFTNTGAKPNA